ncbi:unnamed protein product [Acanthoscelides obtectus]|uniref:Uncharacterized protein n=1 Tax=Acanthoscelides obtectus TaxID=200917 RepID=A0A9P0M8M7_ACAOB|nr:unnamed protein product [Acanthoscelides obtectus]CAK1646657.1 hypothetical protein AOBTE_LOCUS14793 [Acanthoscelides obtectus]
MEDQQPKPNAFIRGSRNKII